MSVVYCQLLNNAFGIGITAEGLFDEDTLTSINDAEINWLDVICIH